jgi:hypothetical protein
MKVISSLLVLFITCSFIFAAKPTPPPIPTTEKDIFEYMTEFEGYLLATGMQADWKTKKRAHWRSECVKGITAKDAAKLLQELVDNVLETSMKEEWGKDKWLNDCKLATSAQQISSLLIQFEANVLALALNPSWETRKPKWEMECAKAPLEGVSALDTFMHEK